jgi:hypothetical protein
MQPHLPTAYMDLQLDGPENLGSKQIFPLFVLELLNNAEKTYLRHPN